jgi:hypothetical protein
MPFTGSATALLRKWRRDSRTARQESIPLLACSEMRQYSHILIATSTATGPTRTEDMVETVWRKLD